MIARLTVAGALLALAACAPRTPPAPVAAAGRTSPRFDPLAPLLDSAIRARVIPGGVVAVSWRGERFLYGAGRLALDDPARPDGHSVYDLASLTKILATTTVALEAVREGRLDLDAPVQRYLPAFRGPGKERVTIRHLLTHSSGLRADSPLWRLTPSADSALGFVNAMPLDTVPGARMVYSDMGAIAMGEVLERIYGASLDRLARHKVFGPRALNDTRFRPPASWIPRIAATEYDTAWRKRIVRGEVHDEKSAWLGGVAGHAGLFGSALDVVAFGEWWLVAYRGNDPLAREFTRRQEVVPGSSRALGWDTPSNGSSAGIRLDASSFGHTGFTGTSLWVDPTRELVVVLLTNRVHPTRNNPAIGPLRIGVANAVVSLIETGRR